MTKQTESRREGEGFILVQGFSPYLVTMSWGRESWRKDMVGRGELFTLWQLTSRKVRLNMRNTLQEHTPSGDPFFMDIPYSGDPLFRDTPLVVIHSSRIHPYSGDPLFKNTPLVVIHSWRTPLSGDPLFKDTPLQWDILSSHSLAPLSTCEHLYVNYWPPPATPLVEKNPTVWSHWRWGRRCLHRPRKDEHGHLRLCRVAGKKEW